MIVYVGESSDPQDNPALACPESRKHLTVGALTISQATPQQGAPPRGALVQHDYSAD